MPSTEILSNTGMKNAPHFSPMTSTTGSVPLIADLAEEERASRPFPSRLRSKLVPTLMAQSANWCGSPSNVGYFQQRFLKPVGLAPPRFVPRASSADTRNNLGPWTTSNSPTRGNLLNFRKETPKPTSSELSLCSSPSNGPDEVISQSAYIAMCKDQPHAVAQYDFDTRIDGDLQFRAGDVILLQEAINDSWYRGRSLATGQIGIFPVNHVTIRIDLNGTPLGKLPQKDSQPIRVNKDDELNLLPPDVIEAAPTPSANTTNNLSKIGKIDISAFEMKRAGSDGSFKSPRGSPVKPPTPPIKPTIPSLHRFKTEQNQSVQSSTPPVILCLRPRSQNTVSQLAHTLEQRGVAINRTGHLPVVAKVLFPSANKQSTSPTDIHKLSPWRQDNESRNRSSLHPTPWMVKTPLAVVTDKSTKEPGGLKPVLTGMASNPDFSLNMVDVRGRNTRRSTPGDSPVNSLAAAISDINLRNRLTDRQHNSPPVSIWRRASRSNVDDTNSPTHLQNDYHGQAPSSNYHTISTKPAKDKLIVDISSNHTTAAEAPRAEISFSATNQATSRFPKNAYHADRSLIMNTHPKERTPNSSIGEPSGTISFSNVDHWLLVLHDYVAVEPGDLTVKAGHVIRCLTPLPPPANMYDLDITPDCWLHCVTWFNVEGQVPSTFVRRILDPEELERWMQCRPRAKVMYEFNAEIHGDLELKVGDLVYLHEAIDANWYRGENAATGHKGMFPAPFVRVLYPL